MLYLEFGAKIMSAYGFCNLQEVEDLKLEETEKRWDKLTFISNLLMASFCCDKVVHGHIIICSQMP